MLPGLAGPCPEHFKSSRFEVRIAVRTLRAPRCGNAVRRATLCIARCGAVKARRAKRMVDNAYRDAQRNEQMTFWRELRSKPLDFKRFMRTYSKKTGRGMGQGKHRLGEFDWAQRCA